MPLSNLSAIQTIIQNFPAFKQIIKFKLLSYPIPLQNCQYPINQRKRVYAAAAQLLWKTVGPPGTTRKECSASHAFLFLMLRMEPCGKYQMLCLKEKPDTMEDVEHYLKKTELEDRIP